MPLTVHHLHVGQSERIVWLCEELGVPYTLKTYNRDPVLSPPDLAALTPEQSAPVITDTNRVTGVEFNMSESGAIAEYILNVYGDGRLVLKPDHPNYPDYVFWFHFANGSLHPTLSRALVARMLNPTQDHPFAAGTEGNVHKVLGSVDVRLRRTNAWLAGDQFTAADIMSVFTLTSMRQWYPVDLSNYQGILAYLQRVGRRDKYIASMAMGDPDLDIEKGLSAKGPDKFPALVELESLLGATSAGAS